ncbi:hypothetical protein [Stutzerimonas balearica]|uniref:hypothetical protein n=1 Tax=Stutzerimonas balearica TaxID=74829 RepID=UPI000C414848|nr:hypothetical protein [Pseudomonas sp.]|tara:strand:- start:609 stop:1007 length:399 start_codon:yes stop_codon:yes gene_type:complete
MNSHPLMPLITGEQLATAAQTLGPLLPIGTDPYFAAWKKGAELIGGEAFPFAQGGINTWADAQLGPLPALLKTLNSLDLPRRALLLTMISLERPEQVHWITRELGMHYGHLSARQLGDEVFAATFDLLRTHH